MENAPAGNQPDPVDDASKNKKRVRVSLLKRHVELSILRLLVIALLFGAAGSYVILKSLASSNTPQTANTHIDNTLGIQAKRETMQLVGLTKRLQKSPGNQTLIQQIQSLAAERKAVIQSLISQQPSTAIQIHFPSSLISGLPAGVQANIEKEVTLQGQLDIYHGELIDSSNKLYNPVYSYFLKDSSGGQSQLYFAQDAGEQAEHLSRDTVKITGLALGTNVAVNSTADVTVVSQTLAATTGTTNKKLAVILFNFKDNPTNKPWTTDQVRTAVFGPTDPSVGNYYKENSYGLVGLTGKLSSSGDVFGWYTINYDSTSACGLPPTDWSSAAYSAAQAAGVDLSGYDNFMYAWPQANCPFAGAAYLNGNEIWINGFATNKQAVAHELGHDFGVHHANSYSCKDNNGSVVFISSNCTSQEYGDPFDAMDNSGIAWHMNALHKGQLGYFSAANTQTVTTSGTYTIAPLEQPNSGPQAIKVLEANGSGGKNGSPAQYYYLEYRALTGYDNPFNNDPATQAGVGVLIHLGPDYSVKGLQTQLLDTTPGSSTYNTYSSFPDAALKVGSSVYDPTNKITFTNKSATTTSDTVDIQFNSSAPTNNCVHYNPAITANPASQWGNAGDVLTYAVTVSNNDSSTCAASTFNVTSNIPAGLTQSPASNHVTLAPGATSTLTYTVTSSSTLAAGYYNFVETATNTSSTSFTASATLAYNVYQASDTVAPSVTITSPADGASIKKSVVVKAGATDNVSIASMEIYIDGALKATGATGAISYSWSTSRVARGNHTITVKAYDSAGNVGQSQVTVVK